MDAAMTRIGICLRTACASKSEQRAADRARAFSSIRRFFASADAEAQRAVDRFRGVLIIS